MNNTYVLTGIFLMAVVTFLSRALPFYCMELFQNNPIIQFIAKALPFPIMIILVFYSIGDVSPLKYPYGLPEVLGILVTAVIHGYYRHLLLSIGVGILFYSVVFLLM